MKNTIEMIIFAVPDKEAESGFITRLVSKFHRYYMGNDCVELENVDISYEEPDLTRGELVAKAVETLRNKQKNAIAEAERLSTDLQVMIDRLLMIEHKSNLDSSLHTYDDGLDIQNEDILHIHPDRS